ncbi:MAG: hypothetical protein JO307_01575 [Bryobacterales bacterium]|nr:hypothetical protein [Bryobacterales bacterium]MBV9400085.1 hypothetical protein [Bryobacterales bacterium]
MEIASPSALGAFARDLRAEDLLECLSINPGRIGDELVGRARAIEIWRSLVRSPSFSSTVIEAARPSAGHRIVGFGSGVFVSRAFALAELSDPRPGINSRILAGIDSGPSVILNEAQLRAGNTRGGLDMVVLHASLRHNVLSPQDVSEVASAMAARFMEQHLGYRIDRLMLETVCAEEAARLAAMYIWRPVRKFDETEPPARCLWVITREEALSVAGSVVNPLFHHREPVLRLRDADQHLLLSALSGLTDQELSSNLGLSLTAVKKRWISIFERTIDVRPDLFPDLDRPDLDGSDGQKRGRQKRHHVLAYVRSHPEELRPFENEQLREASTIGD